MRRETLAALNEAQRAGRAMVRAMDLRTGEERLLDPETDRSPLGLAAAQAALHDNSTTIELEGRSWFLSVHNPPLDLAIVGAVHIAQSLAHMALMAGYQVRVIDPRTGFASTHRFPGVPVIHEWPEETFIKHPLGRRSALVVLAHDPKIDDPALIAALKSPCFYIGALGSRKNQAARAERLKQAGFDEAALARVHGPVGLAIGAKSPMEIAISILAEMTQVLRG